MKTVTFSLESGNQYFGKVDGGPRFYIGTRTSYKGRKGLSNERGTAAQRYDRSQFRATYGFWADFIHPTAMAEGALYHTLNTYDRARFTFSFLQYAAHVPNGDFVEYMRALLELPLAAEYFPDLALRNGRICRIKDGVVDPLESNQSTNGLMDYLNPTSTEVEDVEVIQSAKFIHWVQNDPDHRLVQVDTGIRHFRAKMFGYAQQFKLDGRPDTSCLMVADILHQGRQKSVAEIRAALKEATPLDALLRIGADDYPERIETLRKEIKKLVVEGTLGGKVYNLSKKDFV